MENLMNQQNVKMTKKKLICRSCNLSFRESVKDISQKGYEVGKWASVHVWECKIFLKCRRMMPFVFTDRYDLNKVCKQIYGILRDTRKWIHMIEKRASCSLKLSLSFVFNDVGDLCKLSGGWFHCSNFDFRLLREKISKSNIFVCVRTA